MYDGSDVCFEKYLVACFETNDEIDSVARLDRVGPDNIGVIVVHAEYVVVAFTGGEWESTW